MASSRENTDIINSFFIGPKGSNLADFRANINIIIDELLEARLSYFPQDNEDRFITKSDRRSEVFKRARDNLSGAVRTLAQLLGERSVPFWSPRYQAHMCTDLTMPSLLGYFMTMLYNPNNVALEASPVTTVVELKVGQQLCKLFGFNPPIDFSTSKQATTEAPNADAEPAKYPVGWGHVTCDGTVANLESIWVARNLKFYPLVLHKAIVGSADRDQAIENQHENGGPLYFIGDRFTVKVDGHEKLYRELTNWELLNLPSDLILNIPQQLYDRFGISGKFLETVIDNYNVQTAGRRALEEQYGITQENSIQYFISKTRHYSWPKGAAIAGLGSGCIEEIDVNVKARIDLGQLEEKLMECGENQRAVYAVVAIIGSTEEGAVDNLSEILEIRERVEQAHGLRFLVHADAAWGGYFSTMLGPEPRKPGDKKFQDGQVPALFLRDETEKDLRELKNVDTITVDPHKAGYIPYPAGSLVYRDGRMKNLVTWSSPYLSQGSADNIGIYGVEGSKPGAAAMSTWFSNQAIGLNPDGYGRLLGEAAFTSGRLSAHYATMQGEAFVCVPFNRLPKEKNEGTRPSDGEWEGKEINIYERQNDSTGITNADIVGDPNAMSQLRELGSDLNINLFALNFYNQDGTINNDLDEANYFMKRIVDELSITSAETRSETIPMFVTSTVLEPKEYGECAKTFMRRLGIKPCNKGLFVLRNVAMSPFPTQNQFIDKLMAKFKEVVEKHAEHCQNRNNPTDYKPRFLIQNGRPSTPSDKRDVFLVLQTSFHTATLRQQLIFSATLDGLLTDQYRRLARDDNRVVLQIEDTVSIEEVDKGGQATGKVTLRSLLKSRPLNSDCQDIEYPAECTPFYFYGTNEHKHMVHMLLKSPNIALAASDMTFEPKLEDHSSKPIIEDNLSKGLILGLSNVREASVQPLPTPDEGILPEHFFFSPQKKFNVLIWKDVKTAYAKGPGLIAGLKREDAIYQGTITLGDNVIVDATIPNKDPYEPPVSNGPSMIAQLNDIERALSNAYKPVC
ncbi:PLP-dependent transferase [Aspergillus avenaceus]|uniref:PLP-dependent transferase n=1 Tax=Aspergillus avenaceus TaxID=36643 RepID=A0A5N6U3J6_ASPAV|nr:PLP-dependent transferase [Aspergillus avenaceus]